MNPEEKKEENSAASLARAYRDAAPYLNIGWHFLASILLGVWAGYELDQKFDTGAVYTLLGAFLGLAVGFLNLYKIVMELKSKK
jgi:F0F1-type ATP synthase assembly protein I